MLLPLCEPFFKCGWSVVRKISIEPVGYSFMVGVWSWNIPGKYYGKRGDCPPDGHLNMAILLAGGVRMGPQPETRSPPWKPQLIGTHDNILSLFFLDPDSFAFGDLKINPSWLQLLWLLLWLVNSGLVKNYQKKFKKKDFEIGLLSGVITPLKNSSCGCHKF